MALAKRDEGKKVNSNINVTPMVDVMLVLLIIFMVITPMLQKGRSVDLAKTNNPIQMPDADKEDALLVAVTRDNRIFFGNDVVNDPGTLTDKVRDRLQNKTDKRVFIKADARAKYGTVVTVVDNVRSAGVDQVGLLTEQKKPLLEISPGNKFNRSVSGVARALLEQRDFAQEMQLWQWQWEDPVAVQQPI